MNDAAIELRGIVKSYGKKQVLSGLDLAGLIRGQTLFFVDKASLGC